MSTPVTPAKSGVRRRQGTPLHLHDLDVLFEDFEARPHWGEICFHTRDRIRKPYPEYESRVAVRRGFDPNGVSLNDSQCQLVG